MSGRPPTPEGEISAAAVADLLDLLFTDLPRQGPGSTDATRAALAVVADLPAAPRVVDFGCGTGAQTLVLAEQLKARIRAVDHYPPFLRRLTENARRAGLSRFVQTARGDMARLSFGAAGMDLIWCEGAAYAIGFEAALARWRDLLRPGGWLVISECHWLTGDPPPAAKRFWAGAYPAMTLVETARQTARAAGYQIFDTQLLPPAAWWDTYYTPLSARLAALKAEAGGPGRAALRAMISDLEREIEIRAQYPESYGYVFHILRRDDV